MLEIKHKSQLEIKAKQKQEFKFLGNTRRIPGLKIFKFSYETFEVKEVVIKKSNTVDIEGNPTENNKVFCDPKCYYFQCHNLRTAVEKANKIVKEKTGVEDYFKLENGKVLRKVTV
jgi:hypothetical protein